MKIKEKIGVRYRREYPHGVMAEAVPIEGRAALGNKGFTLLELLVVILIIGILVGLAIPFYAQLKNAAKISRCAEEIRGIEKAIFGYQADQGKLPPSLVEVGLDTLKDPWGNLYEYHKIGETGWTPYSGHFTEPLNSDFDLFSTGANGVSNNSLLLTSADYWKSKDDVIRTGDGGWVGEADNM